MRLSLLLIFFISSFSALAQDAWTQLNDFPFETFTSSSFVVGEDAYVVIADQQFSLESELYRYDVDDDTWFFVTDIPEDTSSFSFGAPFVLGDRVFFTGYDSDIDGMKLWEFDVITTTFEERTGYDFNGFGLYGYTATSFSIGNIGYVLTSSPSEGDNVNFIAYDPDTDSWSEKSQYPSDISLDTCSFKIHGKGYVVFSMDVGAEGNFINDLWEYDPETDSWTEKAEHPFSFVSSPVSLAIDEMAYVASGYINDTVYRYNPIDNVWESIESPGIFFENSFGFSIANFGYIGLGVIDNVENQPSDQIWRLDPELLSVTEVNTINVSIFPNPVTDVLFIQSSTPIQEATVYTILGQAVLTAKIENNQLDVLSLSKGIYLLQMMTEAGIFTQRLVKN